MYTTTKTNICETIGAKQVIQGSYVNQRVLTISSKELKRMGVPKEYITQSNKTRRFLHLVRPKGFGTHTPAQTLNRYNNHLGINSLKEFQTNKVFYNFTFDKGRLKSLVSWSLKNYGEYKTIHLLENLKKVGFEYATKAGISLGIEDLKIPPKKALLLYEAEEIAKKATDQYNRSEITGVERFQRLIDTWHRTSEQLKQEVIDHFENTDVLNPVYMMAFSGARGNISQVRQLVGMRGLMADPKGQIIDYAIRSNFREGLTLTEYIISCYGARKGIVDTALRTANAGYLTRRLVDVAQHVVISNYDCGTKKGIFLTDMKEGNKTIYSLQTRLLGRVLARDIYKKKNSTNDTTIGLPAEKLVLPLAKRNQEITADLSFELIKHAGPKIFVRSPLTCETKKLICQLCYGWSLAQGNLVSIGEAVGIVAAQSIGEPGTQLTMRTFHTGGVFSGDVSDQIRAPYKGFVHYFEQIAGTLIRSPEGKMAFLTKVDGSMCVYNKDNDISSAKVYKIPAYTILYYKNGEAVIEKQVIAQISTIARQQNMRDDSELTVKSQIQGQFFVKTLQIEEKFIGPKLKNPLNAEQNGSNSMLDTIDAEYLNSNNLDSDLIDSDNNNINPLLMTKIMASWDWGYAWILSCKLYRIPIFGQVLSNELKLVPQFGDFVDRNSIMSKIKWVLPPHGGHYTFVDNLGSKIVKNRGVLPTGKTVSSLPNTNLANQPYNTTKKAYFKNPNFIFNNINIKKSLLNIDIDKIYYHKNGYFLENNDVFIFLPSNLKGLNSTHCNWKDFKQSLALQSPNNNNKQLNTFSFYKPLNELSRFFGIQVFPKNALLKGIGLLTSEELFCSTYKGLVFNNHNFITNNLELGSLTTQTNRVTRSGRMFVSLQKLRNLTQQELASLTVLNKDFKTPKNSLYKLFVANLVRKLVQTSKLETLLPVGKNQLRSLMVFPSLEGDRVTQANATHELASSSQKDLQALKDNTKAKNLDFTFKQTLTGLAIPQDNFAKELSSPSDFWPASPTYKNYLVFFNKKGILNKCVLSQTNLKLKSLNHFVDNKSKPKTLDPQKLASLDSSQGNVLTRTFQKDALAYKTQSHFNLSLLSKKEFAVLTSNFFGKKTSLDSFSNVNFMFDQLSEQAGKSTLNSQNVQQTKTITNKKISNVKNSKTGKEVPYYLLDLWKNKNKPRRFKVQPNFSIFNNSSNALNSAVGLKVFPSLEKPTKPVRAFQTQKSSFSALGSNQNQKVNTNHHTLTSELLNINSNKVGNWLKTLKTLKSKPLNPQDMRLLPVGQSRLKSYTNELQRVFGQKNKLENLLQNKYLFVFNSKALLHHQVVKRGEPKNDAYFNKPTANIAPPGGEKNTVFQTLKENNLVSFLLAPLNNNLTTLEFQPRFKTNLVSSFNTKAFTFLCSKHLGFDSFNQKRNTIAANKKMIGLFYKFYYSLTNTYLYNSLDNTSKPLKNNLILWFKQNLHWFLPKEFFKGKTVLQASKCLKTKGYSKNVFSFAGKPALSSFSGSAANLNISKKTFNQKAYNLVNTTQVISKKLAFKTLVNKKVGSLINIWKCLNKKPLSTGQNFTTKLDATFLYKTFDKKALDQKFIKTGGVVFTYKIKNTVPKHKDKLTQPLHGSGTKNPCLLNQQLLTPCVFDKQIFYSGAKPSFCSTQNNTNLQAFQPLWGKGWYTRTSGASIINSQGIKEWLESRINKKISKDNNNTPQSLPKLKWYVNPNITTAPRFLPSEFIKIDKNKTNSGQASPEVKTERSKASFQNFSFIQSTSYFTLQEVKRLNYTHDFISKNTLQNSFLLLLSSAKHQPATKTGALLPQSNPKNNLLLQTRRKHSFNKLGLLKVILKPNNAQVTDLPAQAGATLLQNQNFFKGLKSFLPTGKSLQNAKTNGIFSYSFRKQACKSNEYGPKVKNTVPNNFKHVYLLYKSGFNQALNYLPTGKSLQNTNLADVKDKKLNNQLWLKSIFNKQFYSYAKSPLSKTPNAHLEIVPYAFDNKLFFSRPPYLHSKLNTASAYLKSYVITYNVPSGIFDYQFKKVDICVNHLAHANILVYSLVKQETDLQACQSQTLFSASSASHKNNLKIKPPVNHLLQPLTVLTNVLSYYSNLSVFKNNNTDLFSSAKYIKNSKNNVINMFIKQNSGLDLDFVSTNLPPGGVPRSGEQIMDLLASKSINNSRTNLSSFTYKKALLALLNVVCFEFNLILKFRNYKYGLKPLTSITEYKNVNKFKPIKNKSLVIYNENSINKYKSQGFVQIPNVTSLNSPSQNISQRLKDGPSFNYFKTNYKVYFDNINYALNGLANTSFLSSYTGEIIKQPLNPNSFGYREKILNTHQQVKKSNQLLPNVSNLKDLSFNEQNYPYVKKQIMLNNKQRCLLLTKQDLVTYSFSLTQQKSWPDGQQNTVTPVPQAYWQASPTHTHNYITKSVFWAAGPANKVNASQERRLAQAKLPSKYLNESLTPLRTLQIWSKLKQLQNTKRLLLATASFKNGLDQTQSGCWEAQACASPLTITNEPLYLKQNFLNSKSSMRSTSFKAIGELIKNRIISFDTISSSKIGSFILRGDIAQKGFHYIPQEGDGLMKSLTSNQAKSNFNKKTNINAVGQASNAFQETLTPQSLKKSLPKAYSISGQVVHINKEQITVRKAQPIFISAKSTFHAFHGDFVQNKEHVITLIYQKLKTGDIIQGIPKVEQFFESRTTKRGRLFRDNLPNLLKGLFIKYYVYSFKLLKQGFTDVNTASIKAFSNDAGGLLANKPVALGKHWTVDQQSASNVANLDFTYLALQWAVKQSFYKIQQIAVDGVLRVYRSQGVTISDKHLEIIVKQMTTKVRVIQGGQTGFFPGEFVDLDFVETINSCININNKDASRKTPLAIYYEPVILGITKASLQVDSFLSSASFQQTARILSQSALFNKKDFLKGVKENVILGNLIPAGTGYLVSFFD